MGIQRTMMVSKRLEILLTSADTHSALQRIAEEGIETRDIIFVDDLNLRLIISRKSYDALLAVCKKRGDSVQILRYLGPMYTLSGLKKRPILLAGILLICLLSIWLPSRVFFVRAEGNVSVPEKLILEKAEQCGIRFGMLRQVIRSDTLKNALLASLPRLQWAGINTYGCTAVITVREGTKEKAENEDTKLMCLIALRDAIVQKMTVMEGNALCAPGDRVIAGQVLVSPYTDCGLSVRVTNARAEIYGQTQRQLAVISPTEYHKRTEITGREKKYSLIIGKKRINLYKGSGISGTTCAKIYEEKYITLPGGFVLPLGIISEEYVHYQFQPVQIDLDSDDLEAYAKNYLLGTMLAGEIQRADHVFFDGPQLCRLDSVFLCYEMIAISHPEEAITKDE